MKHKENKKFQKGMMALQGFILFNLLWQIAAWWVKSPALPAPAKVYAKLPEIWKKGLAAHVLASCNRLMMGLVLSLLIGGCVGLAMGKNKKIDGILSPLIYFIYPIPKTALLPILMILYGLGDCSKITLIVLITVFQVIVTVRDSVLRIDPTYYHVIKSLGGRRMQCFWQVTLPALLPDLLTTMRISVGTALSVLFFAENYGTQYGLGYFIQDAWGRLSYISMYGGILAMSILGCILFMLIDGLAVISCKGSK